MAGSVTHYWRMARKPEVGQCAVNLPGNALPVDIACDCDLIASAGGTQVVLCDSAVATISSICMYRTNMIFVSNKNELKNIVVTW